MTVVNKRTHKPTKNDVYIGRGSIWGNPFIIGKDGSRYDVITSYRHHIRIKLMHNQPLVDELKALKGKTLVCYCAPLPCHGNVLEGLIEQLEEEERAGFFTGE